MQQFLSLLLIAALTGAAAPAAAEPEPTPKVLAKRVVGNEPWRANEVRIPVGLITDLMVVGTPSDTEEGVLSGAVFVFKINGNDWTQVQKITPPAPADGFQFGFALSIEEQIDSGEAWLAVGAPAKDNGRVFLYKREGDTFAFKQLLTGVDFGDFFGYSVAINVDIPTNQEDQRWTLAVGAPQFKHDIRPRKTGAVFISNLGAGDNWGPPGLPLSAAENSPDIATNIGYSVALDGDFLITGAPNQQVNGQNGAGAVYIASRGAPGTWVQGTAIENPDPIEGQSFNGANFGESVAMVKQIVPTRVPTGNYVYVVGAPEPTTDVPGGSVYVIDAGLGGLASPQRLLRPGVPASLDRFGISVAIRQDLINGDHKILIGYVPGTNNVVGAAYLYDQPDFQDPWVVKRRFIIGNTDVLPNATARFRAVAAWNSLLALSTANGTAPNDAVFTTDPSVIVEADFE